LESIELGLISLYHALDPEEFDLNQLGDPPQVDNMSADPSVALPQLTEAVNLELRRDRYAASLAYVLGVRYLQAGGPIEAELNALGAKIVTRFGNSDPYGSGESALRNAVSRLIGDATITTQIGDDMATAFEGKVRYTVDPETGLWSIEGEATEAALMLCELGSMGANCSTRNAKMLLGGTAVEVLIIECEMCTQLPFERIKDAIDPRNWDDKNPGFFQSIQVLAPVPSPPGGTWNGVIQEKVGALFLGTPLVTNLAVSYFEANRVAVTTYDLAADSAVKEVDDGKVKVDYGFWAVTEEGVHRRTRLLKVVRIENTPWPAWFHPLWAQQLLMMGYWVS
jgi:hypothetical protein